MGRTAGTIAAGLAVAAMTAICAPAAARTPASAIMIQNAPITAADAEKAGTQPPPPPYNPNAATVKYVDPGMPTPEPPDRNATPAPTPTSTPTPSPPQVKIEGVRTDRVPTPGQILFDKTRDIAFMDPLNWSVTIFKKRHQLIVYYKGRTFKTYRAVFGRSFEPGTKLWEGDRRTPEGVYTIVEKHRSRRWLWFLTLNYPNAIDRQRYDELRQSGELPSNDGHLVGVGGRIGIHGTDEPALNRGDVNWTTGCISVDDDDVEELKRLLPTGTVVIIKP
jgi:lipoprotein-anchoring transpeptidase ErfK/SrfK